MSGALALMMAGASASAGLNILGGTASRTSTSVGTASYTLTSGGLETLVDLGTSSRTYSATPSLYEVRATLTSGSLTAGTTGSWLALTATRTWSCTQSVVGVANATLTIEVRIASTLVVVDTATVTLHAEFTP